MVTFSDPLESAAGQLVWGRHQQPGRPDLYCRLEQSLSDDGMVLHASPFTLQGELDTFGRAQAIYEAHVAELAEFGQPPPAGWTLLFDPREPEPQPGLTFA